MNWKEEKERALNSIETLNSSGLNLNLSIKFGNSLGVGRSGRWKTVYNNNSNLSESFKTWHEVAIFLSGLRLGVTDSIKH